MRLCRHAQSLLRCTVLLTKLGPACKMRDCVLLAAQSPCHSLMLPQVMTNLCGGICFCLVLSVLQEARKQNERKRQRDSPAALQARLTDLPQAPKPAAVTVREVPPAEALKEQGNTALKQGKLPEVLVATCSPLLCWVFHVKPAVTHLARTL